MNQMETVNYSMRLNKFIIIIMFLIGCNKQEENTRMNKVVSDKKKQIVNSAADTIAKSDSIIEKSHISPLEQSLIEANLVDIQSVDSTILVDLKYSSEDNFVKIDLYGELEKCYLQRDVALKLSNAQKLLKERYPELTLLVYDGVRPLAIQKILWDTIDVPLKIKHFFVANPDSASIHNYGAAVDLSLADTAGNPLDMGTPFDYFGPLAYPIKEYELLKEGKLTAEQINNRLILRNVMKDAGFSSITTEWWHFNSCSKLRASKKYEIIR